MGYNKIRHIKKSNLILENRLLNEDNVTGSTGNAKTLANITGVPEEVFKYFDTKKPTDINTLYTFSNSMSQNVQNLNKDGNGQQKIDEMLKKLDETSISFNDYEKKLINWLKDTIQSQASHFQIYKGAQNQPEVQGAKMAQDKTITDADNDYDYKREKGKYYFKLKDNPKSTNAQNLRKQGKYTNCSLATGNVEKIIKRKLDF
jgi:hypothetical protein